jgi:spermidine synthase
MGVVMKDNFEIYLIISYCVIGFLGMILEISYIKLLSKIFGSSFYSVSIITSAWMSALGFGYLFFGKLSLNKERIKSLFSFLVIFIGVYTILSPFFIEIINKITIGFNYIFGFVFGFIFIFIFAFFIGGFFLLLIRYFDNKSISLSFLYSTNSFFSALGALVSSFFMKEFGIKETITFSGFIMIGLGVLKWVACKLETLGWGFVAALRRHVGVQRKLWLQSLLCDGKGNKSKANALQLQNSKASFATTISFLFGFLSLSFEILFIRFFSIIFGPSSYTYSIVISVYIIQISIGSFVYFKFKNIFKNDLFEISYIFVFSMVLSVLVLIFGDNIPFVFTYLVNILGDNIYSILLVEFFIVFFSTLFCGCFFGFSICYLSGLLEEDKRTDYENLLFFNSIGSFFGPVVCAFILVGFFRIFKTFIILISLTLLFFLISLFVYYRRFKYLSISFAGLFFVFFLSGYRWNEKIILSGSYLNREWLKGLNKNEFLKRVKDEIVFYQDGVHFSVGVLKNEKWFYLKIDGKTDASTGIDDMWTQVLSGNLPFVFSSKAENALLIGLGSGITLSEIESYDVKNIDVVEIEPAVIDAAEYFNEYNNKCLSDKRVRIIKNDGRNYLLKTKKKYDVIISETTNVWVKGSTDMFTKELIKLLKDRLSDNGVCAYWFQIYNMEVDDFKRIVKTFFGVFDYGYVFTTNPFFGDIIMIGSKKRPVWNNELLEKITDRLKRIKIESKEELIERFIFDKNDIFPLVFKYREFVDNKPELEFNSIKLLFSDTQKNLIALSKIVYFLNENSALPEMIEDRRIDMEKLLESYSENQRLGQLKKLVEIKKSFLPEKVYLNYKGLCFLMEGDVKKGEELLKKSVSYRYPPSYRNLTNLYLNTNRIDKAFEVAKSFYNIYPESPDSLDNLGWVYFVRGDYDRAFYYFNEAVKRDKNFSDAIFHLGLSFIKRGDFKSGFDYIDRAIDIKPKVIYRETLDKIMSGG